LLQKIHRIFLRNLPLQPHCENMLLNRRFFCLLQAVEPLPRRLAVCFKRSTGSFFATSPFSRTATICCETGGFFVCFRQSNRHRIVWQFASKRITGTFYEISASV